MAHVDAPTTSRSRRSMLTIIAAVTAVAVLAAVVFLGLRAAGVIGAPVSEPQSGSFSTPGPQEPASLPSTAGESDLFDSWRERIASDSVRFLASDAAHDEQYSLLITSTAPAGPTAAAFVSQMKLVPGDKYIITAWAKSLGGDKAAVVLQPGWEDSGNLALPGGAFDWTVVSFEFVAKGATVPLVIYVEGSTDGVFLDSIDVQPGQPSGAPVLDNGGFENNSADLSITNDSLLLATGDAQVNLVTRRADEGWLEWTASNVEGQHVAEGNATFAANSSTIDLTDLSPGYYTIDISAHVGGRLTERSTPFGIVDPVVSEKPLTESPFGIHLHEGSSATRTSNMISTLAAMGIGHVRADTTWNQSEKAPGEYEYQDYLISHTAQYEELGMDALQLPVYSNNLYDGGVTPSSAEGLAAYGAFTRNVLETFSHAGQDVEVYNEFDHTFNNGECGPTAACYIDMLQAVNDAVRPSLPDATIVGPGNAGMGFKWDWLKDFIALDGLDLVDVVSAHPYTQPVPASSMGKDIDRLRSMIRAANGGEDKPIWLTEMGWSTVPNWVTDEEQATYLVQTMAAAFGHGVERVYWYEAIDQRPSIVDVEGNFGLFESDRALLPGSNAPKLAAVAQAVIASTLSGLSPASIDSLGSQVESYVFSSEPEAPGSLVRIMWAPGDPATVTISTTEPVTISDIYGATTTLVPQDGIVSLPLTSSPIYLPGDVSNLKLKK